MRSLILAGIGLSAVLAVAAPSGWMPQKSPATERLRGVSAVSHKVAWASGNKGTVLRTVDGGETWVRLEVPDAAALDFRDIEALDAKTAFVLSIGNGNASRIYRTNDGGRSWTLQFTNPDPKAFYDALAFWDRDHGLAVGDPVDGHMTVLRTADGGRTWTVLPAATMPAAMPGEGAFAASGTCLVAGFGTHAWLGTGGATRARVFHSADRGETWTVATTQLAAANASSGIFSVAFADLDDGVAVGGDYRQERASGDNLQFTTDGGLTWAFPGSVRLPGFRSAVAYIPDSHPRSLIAVGPAGSDRSDDDGRTWEPVAGEGYDALSIEPRGRVAWAVGDGGRIGKLVLR